MKRLVVLDTNCLVQMLSVHSSYRPAWQAFREGKYELSHPAPAWYKYCLESLLIQIIEKSLDGRMNL